jgi:hypothetical protein
LLIDYLEKGATITAKYYVTFFDKLKEQVVSKRRCKFSKGIFFLQDSAAPHKEAITHQKLADLHLEVLKHLAYSPDLTHSGYCLEETTLAADRWFAAQPKELYLDALKKLEQ